MTTYTTTGAQTAARIPTRMRNMKATEIVGSIFNAEIAKKPGSKDTAGLTMLKSCADAFFAKDHWKNAFYAIFPQDADGRDACEWAAAAAIWFHGAEPIRTSIGVHSNGYAC